MSIKKRGKKGNYHYRFSFEGKKYGEIASKLNISVKTVEGQMSKALKVMKEELKDYLIVLIIIILKNNNLL